MKNRYIVFRSIFWILILFIIVLVGCTSGDESLGKDLLPGSSIHKSSSYREKGNIKAFTFTDEKVRVDRAALNYIGSFNDPLFGRTDGSFAAQYRLPYHPDYDPTSSLDSIILRLTYKKIYGDTTTVQTVSAYELAGDIMYEAKYLSSFNLKTLTSPTILGTTSFLPKFKTDSVGTDTTTQYIRIRINSLLGKRLLSLDSLKMISNDEFLKVFKGLYVESSSASRKGTMIGVTPSTSSLGIYYHTNKKDSLFFAYNVTSNSAIVSGFSHDYRNGLFFRNLNQELKQDTLIFVQPTGGTKVKVNVPSLSSWVDSSKYLVNRASITFYVDTLLSDIRRYNIPSRLYLKYMDKSGEEVFPKDSELSSSYYGGYYDEITASYTFNITSHLQQIIDKEVENTSLYLVHSDRAGSPSRVVLKGGNSSKPIELLVNYTRYK